MINEREIGPVTFTPLPDGRLRVTIEEQQPQTTVSPAWAYEAGNWLLAYAAEQEWTAVEKERSCK